MSIEKYGKKSCYNSNPKLKKTGFGIEMTKTDLVEYQKCHDDLIYFVKNYCKIISLDEGLVKFKLYPYQEKAIRKMNDNRFSIFLMARQMGKALDVDTPIPTPSGFKKMGDIKVGDEIFGRDGKTYNVTFATEYQHNRTCYKIMFDDYTSVIADAEHIWTVFGDNGIEIDLTTQEIIDSKLRYYIKNTHKTHFLCDYDEWDEKIKNSTEYSCNDYDELRRLLICGRSQGLHISSNDMKITINRNLDCREISSIEKVESRPVKCIQVNSPDHIFLAGEQFVPTHNTTTVAAYLLHQAIFNKDFNIAVLANKSSSAREILSRIQEMYEELPWFMQPGVSEWNKGSIKLGNGSKIFTAATTPSAVRGRSINIIYLDEFAFVDNDVEFYTSTMPVISSGETTKIIITSTPKGMNLFYKIWTESVNMQNSFSNMRVDWHHHPKRDETWKKTMLEQLGNNERMFSQEYCNEFFGSSDTLISGSKLAQLTANNPIKSSNHLKIFEEPLPDHTYAITVDVSEGVGKDFSVINVFDISQTPYKQVAIFRHNEISPTKLSFHCNNIGNVYNKAYILVESNSIGYNVCSDLWGTYEYDNLMKSTVVKAQNQMTSSSRSELGVRMTKKTKSLGCSNLKELIENDILIINDNETIKELFSFIKDGDTYKAEKGKNDDCAMSLVLFAWFAGQSYFTGLCDINTKEALFRQINEEEPLPFAMFSDGTEQDDIPEGFFSK